MPTQGKKNSIPEQKRSILDYFSQSSANNTADENIQNEKTKRQKNHIKPAVSSELDLENSTSSLVFGTDMDSFGSGFTKEHPDTENENMPDEDIDMVKKNITVMSEASNVMNKNSAIVCSSSNPNTGSALLNTCKHRQQYSPVISKIVADYLDTNPSELTIIDTTELSSEMPQQEERYEFLVDVRDKNKIRKGEDGYDPTTLHIPKKYYDKFTPFEKQFWDIKSKYFDTVIFFKKGKFYELYEDDAIVASKLFDLKIVERVNMKMAGVPESSYEGWAAKFVAHGYKIGRVDQVENSIGKKIREQNGKKDKIIARELKEIITTGTAYSPECIDGCFPFFLGVLIQHNRCNSTQCAGQIHFSILLYDAGANKISIGTFCDSYDCSQLRTVFVQNDVRELITNEKVQLGKDMRMCIPDKTPVVSDRKYDFSIEEEYQCFSYLYNYMKSLCREQALESAVVSNIKEGSDFMTLDGSTLVNLDILTNNFDSTEDHSLFKSINYCSTPFGQRLLRKWIVTPLKNLEMINERRRIAQIFSKINSSEIVQSLKEIGDIERYYGRLGGCSPTFKNLKSFVESLKKANSALKILKAIFSDQCESQSNINAKHLGCVQHVLDQFEKVYLLSDSDILPGNDNDELFVLNRQQVEIQDKLQKFLKSLKKSTGFNDLCYKSIGKEIFQIETGYNNQMPSGFYLVSSTKTQRRYYSDELKAITNEFEECEEKIFQSKGSILRRAVDFLKSFSFDIHYSTNYLACIDCLISFSTFNDQVAVAVPEFGPKLELVDFTNPIFADYIKNTFTPKHNITLVTGPNMGGKSTFLRSICLNIILAQMGMGVLCKSMKLPVFDRIFTRIGASDSLARGESTFMVEMNEASKILNQSTRESFVIMDELGRGTSTRDGEAIARAVLDYLKTVGCMCLFSTHYHKLVENYEDVDKSYVGCKLDQRDITFLYKMQEGVCGDSHGLYIARMAGIPDEIVERAFGIRKALSSNQK
ncbi:uncharacterized protein VICG_00054 [Vittaforma corneae ATCC 50505]|uniref:DNA mismatch repair proteins mutS family domain-containing protein n=1 Tax=Vittaforma corneae (strain ATCC 50505) TaxID=993615 RepID=L2GQ54_VITCO|nr:uncharacterized protein VICG_00054 [Vittaforma corneae ATCC 50505]ELA42739.1 hypothetical protein VICG_00054 [Vittaforma corneae ATCC 50505]